MFHDIKPAHGLVLVAAIVSNFVLITLFTMLYAGGMIQPIVDVSNGLIHPTLILGLPLFVLVVGVVVVWLGRLTPRDAGLEWSRLPSGIAVGLIFWVVVQIIQLLVGLGGTGKLVLDPVWAEEGVAPILGLLIGMLLGTALPEEVIFRGFAVPQLYLKLRDRMPERHTTNLVLAVLVSQVIFSLTHVPNLVLRRDVAWHQLPGPLLGVLLNGVLYALVYLRTNNLFIAMAVHALGNAPTPLLKTTVETPSLVFVFTVLLLLTWPVLARQAALSRRTKHVKG
ncbi:MAG TPA: CPBP family intramembrane glutamic endopeptidase [Anaerolineae bacterium]|nr:CPBP family intramembrane glutamic endopeptidase [Anaerolineae bacterium]